MGPEGGPRLSTRASLRCAYRRRRLRRHLSRSLRTTAPRPAAAVSAGIRPIKGVAACRDDRTPIRPAADLTASSSLPAADRAETQSHVNRTTGSEMTAKNASEQGKLTGAPGRIRTCGLLLRRQTLYPLSYGGAADQLRQLGLPRLTHPKQDQSTPVLDSIRDKRAWLRPRWIPRCCSPRSTPSHGGGPHPRIGV